MTGLLFVIEGPDGVGTTTQAERLATSLGAHLTAEPSAGPWGQQVRRSLSSSTTAADFRSMALGFAADRLHHVDAEIVPAIEKGQHVVSDRYLLSSLVYQSLHVERRWVQEINRYARPADLVILLELDLDEALARISARKGTEEVYDERELQARVHRAYAQVAQTRENVVRVSAAGAIDEVAARILSIANARVEDQ